MARNPYKSPTFKHSSLESGWSPLACKRPPRRHPWWLKVNEVPAASGGGLLMEFSVVSRVKKGVKKWGEEREREQFSPPVHMGRTERGIKKGEPSFSF